MMSLVRRYRLEVGLFALVLGLGSWFFNGYGWNQTARYDPIWAWVEPGPNQHTLAIDDFMVDPAAGLNTGDFARNPDHSEHYYSNKAPGVSLLGIPAYFVLYHGERLLGLDPVSVAGVLINAYLINVWVTVLPVALSAAFFLHLAGRFTRDRSRALWLTLLLYAGTLMLPFSTALWGHTTAAALAVMATACFVAPGRRAALFGGFFVGLAVLSDYGAAPLAVTLVVAAALGADRRIRLPALALGGLGPLLAFAAYHWSLFGSPLRLASSYSTPDMLNERHVLGMFGPLGLEALWGLTFGTARGLFVFMPVLLLSLYSIRRVREQRDRSFWWLALANIVLILLVNMSYNTWQGGVSAGARYQIIALPFWVLILALLPDGRRVRWALGSLSAISFANMFVLAAVSPMAPDALRGSPLFFSWAKLWRVLKIDLGLEVEPIGGSLSRGSLHVYPTYPMRDWSVTLTDPVIERYGSFNVGELLLGLSGIPSLLPALAGSVALAVWLLRTAAHEDSADAA